MKFYADRAILTPLGLHWTLWYAADYCADSSILMLVGALLAVFFTSLLAGAAMTPGPAVLSSLWVPALATVFDLYWRFDTRAPYAPAKALLWGEAWDMTGGRTSFILLCAVVAAGGIAAVVLSPPASKAFNRFSWSDSSDE